MFYAFIILFFHCKKKRIYSQIFNKYLGEVESLGLTTFFIISFHFSYNSFTQKNINKINERFKRFLIPYIIWVNINEDEIFKYDPNSYFYNDRCFPNTSDRGTDIIINDRKKEYNDKNLALCEKDCNFIGYDKNNKKVSYECKPKIELEKNVNIFFDKYLLLHKFTDFKTNTNFYVIFCYHIFFTLDGIESQF